MRRTGRYYSLNLTLAFMTIIGTVMMACMDGKPRWTDWLNPLPHGIGTGGNGKGLLCVTSAAYLPIDTVGPISQSLRF